MAQPLLLPKGKTTHILRHTERVTAMLQSHCIQDHVSVSEDRDLMLFSVWLLACALLLEEHYQQPR
jgi:hypothetical protein